MNKAPKHIAVNTRLLLKGNLEGIGRFADEILKRLVQDHPETQFSFYFDRDFDEKFIYGPNVKAYKLFPPARQAFLFIWFFEYAIARMNRKLKPDVFFSPEGYISLRSKVPQVATFHDLAFEHFPQDVDKWAAWHYKKYYPKYAQRADRIITVSEYTKQDVLKHYPCDPGKFTVVSNASNALFRPSSEAEKAATRQRFSEGKAYFHAVGAIQPRKNLDRLIQAFDLFKENSGSELKLLLVGRKAWNFEEVIHSYSHAKYKDDIVFTGYLSDEELVQVYGGSEGLCYVPYFEGFGIPIVEAMACDTPVITSNVTSMPEVAGDAALLVDPLNVEAIAAAMRELAENKNLASELVDKGRLRRQIFTWEASAARIWNVLCSI